MICVICNKKININRDKWVLLRDYNGDKIDGEVYYHLICWKEKDKAFDERCRKKVEQGIQTAKKVLDKSRGKEEIWQIQ